MVIVPKAKGVKGAKPLRDKTDTIAFSHVDLDFLPFTFCHSVDIDCIARGTTQCALHLAGRCRGRNAGAGECIHLAGADAI